MSDATNDRFEFAKKIAIEAGKLTLEYFQNPNVGFERKGDNTPVTVADREAEKMMRAAVEEKYSEDAIVGEEFGSKEGSNQWRWIFDPIDGTKSFISGVPLYGTMVGVEFESKCVIGVVYIPGLDEGVFAVTGQGATHYVKGENRTAKVSKTDSISDAIFVTSEAKSFLEHNVGGVYREMESAAYVTRTWGDCYGYLLVATGRADIMIDPELSIWDAAAVKPIIEEAGGRFLDWKGEPKIDSGNSFACNPSLIGHVQKVINSN